MTSHNFWIFFNPKSVLKIYTVYLQIWGISSSPSPLLCGHHIWKPPMPYASISIPLSNNFSLPHTFRSTAAAAASGGDVASVNGGPFAGSDQFAAAAAYGSSMLYPGQYGPAYGAARYQPPLQPQPPATYTPLVNHTYALAASAAAAAASAASPLPPSSAQTALLENDDASSQKSGRSAKAAKEDLEAAMGLADIKEDPDAAADRAFRIRQSRDERKAREIGVPFTLGEV